MADIYVAIRSFSTVLDGRSRVIKQGATVREGHPLLDGRGANFKLLVPDFEHTPPPKPVAKAPTPTPAPAPKPVTPVARVTPKPASAGAKVDGEGGGKGV